MERTIAKRRNAFTKLRFDFYWLRLFFNNENWLRGPKDHCLCLYNPLLLRGKRVKVPNLSGEGQNNVSLAIFDGFSPFFSLLTGYNEHFYHDFFYL